jgi:hypothetical protein
MQHFPFAKTSSPSIRKDRSAGRVACGLPPAIIFPHQMICQTSDRFGALGHHPEEHS